MHSPRLLCSREYWREFAGTGFHYFLLPHGGRAEYGSQIYYSFSTGLLWSSLSGGTFCPKRGARYLTPHPELWKLWAWPLRGQLIDSGLSTGVVETILHSRAPSTRKLYALKWKVFTSCCSDHQRDPANCPVGTVLEFLQDRFTAGLTPSTLKVYVAAISSYHISLGGMSMEKDPLVSRFLRGTLRLRPAARTRVPTWDLAIVLQGLSLAPFEPLEEVPAKFLTLKALFLLAISSLKRIGDLQALSVAPSCLEFAPGMVKAFLHPRPGYVPKVPANVYNIYIYIYVLICITVII